MANVAYSCSCSDYSRANPFVCMFVYRVIKEQENRRTNEESVHKHIEMNDDPYLKGASALAMNVFDNLSKEEF